MQVEASSILGQNWLEFVPDVAGNIIETLKQKDADYGGSWQSRGGIGAFMMMCRKWDRIENMAKENPEKYDIFDLLNKNTGDVMDDVDDLIGYLLLIRGHHNMRQEIQRLVDSADHKSSIDNAVLLDHATN